MPTQTRKSANPFRLWLRLRAIAMNVGSVEEDYRDDLITICERLSSSDAIEPALGYTPSRGRPPKNGSQKQNLQKSAAELGKSLRTGITRRDDQVLMRDWLYKLAEYQDFPLLIGAQHIGRPGLGHREQRIRDVAIMSTPEHKGGQGRTTKDAIGEIAAVHRISEDSLKADYYSSAGQEIRAEAQASLHGPFGPRIPWRPTAKSANGKKTGISLR